MAGIVGAIGAFCVLLAFGNKGTPGVVMSIVFAGAPIVNAIVAMYNNPPEGGLGAVRWQFYLGIVLAATGGCMVTLLQAAARQAARGPGHAGRRRDHQNGAAAMTRDFPTREATASHQLTQLRQLLAAILPGNAFYRNKLAYLDPSIASLEDFSARFPFTTKQELAQDQHGHAPFGTNLTFPLTSYTRYHQTSGTTSAPLRWLDTPESWGWMVESWREIYQVAGVGGGDRVYFAFSFGPFIGFWLAFEAAQKLGCLCIPGGGLSTQGRLRAISENRATVLCCTPSYAAHLAETAARENFDLTAAAVRVIIVAGEPGGSVPATRQRLEELWPGTRIFDHHGMTETGPVSHECPAQPGTLHLLHRAYLAEVIDADGETARAGRSGRIGLDGFGPDRLAPAAVSHRRPGAHRMRLRVRVDWHRVAGRTAGAGGRNGHCARR